MFNNLSVIEAVFHTYSSYLCTMPDTNKHIDHAISNKLAFCSEEIQLLQIQEKVQLLPNMQGLS